jgi:phospholipid transport system transporter-binding protein
MSSSIKPNQPLVKIEKTGDCYSVAGEIIFDTVMVLEHSGSQLIQAEDKIIFDFSQVVHSDSSALALLLSWLRVANKFNKTISYKNIPEALLIMAQSFDIKTFLPLFPACNESTNG